MTQVAYIYPAFSHMECEVSRLLPSQKLSLFPLALSPGARWGAGAAGVRDVCGPESNVRVFALRLFHNIEG